MVNEGRFFIDIYISMVSMMLLQHLENLDMDALYLHLQTTAYSELQRLAENNLTSLAKTNVGAGNESAAGVLCDLASMATSRCLRYEKSIFPSERIAEQVFYNKYTQFIKGANSFEDIITVETVVNPQLNTQSNVMRELLRNGIGSAQRQIRRNRMKRFMEAAAKTSPHYSKANVACDRLKAQLAVN